MGGGGGGMGGMVAGGSADTAAAGNNNIWSIQNHKTMDISKVKGKSEPPLGVIRDQGKWSFRSKGARSMT